MSKYYHFSFSFKFKVLLDGEKDEIWYSGGVGRDIEEALTHRDFWIGNERERSQNIEIIDTEVEPYNGFCDDPYKCEKLVKKAFANPLEIIKLITEDDVLYDEDKMDLIRAVLNKAPWGIRDCDTIVADTFYELAEKLV